MGEEQRVQLIRKASWVSIIGNTVLALFKLVTGFAFGSLSVAADGIDSSGDVLMSIITLYIASLLNKPPNPKFPYGYGKAETNATSVISFIIFIAGLQLAISSVRKLIAGEVSEMPGKIVIVALIVSIIGKLFLAWYQMLVGKKSNSKMLIANGRNMQGDVLISASVLVGLAFVYFFKLPIIDTIAALAVSIWIIWVAVRIFLETNLTLMDGNIEKSYYKKVFTIIESVDYVTNPHRVRIRSIGHRKMINADIEIDGNKSIREAHEIAHQVEAELKSKLGDVFDVAIHVEPIGFHLEEKVFGLDKENL